MMKKLIFTFLFGTISLFAQTNTIEVLYDIKRNEDVDEMVETMMKNSGGSVNGDNFRNALINSLKEKVVYSLILSQNKSIYKVVPKINNSQIQSNTVSYGDEENIVYKDLGNYFYVKPDFSLGKNYLIKDSLTNYNWTLLNESKEVLNKQAFKAISEDKDFEYVAYYWKDSSISNGPEMVQGLKGLIVELSVNSKKNKKSGIEYKAISVDYNSTKKINSSFKGQYISSLQYDKLSKEFYQKQNEAYNNSIDKKID